MSDLSRTVHIVIGGNIGAGKSTVIRSLQKCMEGLSFVEERVHVWNHDDILGRFYEDMDTWAIPLQNRIINDFYEMYSSMRDGEIYVYERSAWDSLVVFECEKASSEQRDKWESMISHWTPDCYITVNTDPEVCHERIISRARKGEAIELSYLNKLRERQERLHEILRLKGVAMFSVDGHEDPTQVSGKVRDLISTRLR